MHARLSRTLTAVFAAVAFAAGSVSVAGPAVADPPAPPGTPTATSFRGTPTVGPLFAQGLAAPHGCTASVVASPTRDLVLAAAHCLQGTATGWQFAPGYDRGRTPYGVWTVEHVYLDPRWVTAQDPQRDYAILQLGYHRSGGREVGVQDVTGANVLGLAPRPGQRITDIAYNAGLDDQPIRCTVRTYRTRGYPSFNCHGYVGGSSGSPWLARVPGTNVRVVQGVIGGLHQGGCYEYTSYSSRFTPAVFRLLARGILRRHPDTAPVAGSDGCSTGL